MENENNVSVPKMDPVGTSLTTASAKGSYKRDGLVVLVATVFSVSVAVGFYYYFLRPPEVDWTKESTDIVRLVGDDSYWFHVLYIRWTAVDWILAFLATGTALSAVIKNSMSVKSDASPDLSKWDRLLIVLALCAVLGTTFDGKIHAGQLADRYRAGDLILQEAKMDYAGSQKDDTAKKHLREQWHEAQQVLESKVVAQKTPQASGNGAILEPIGGRDQSKSASPSSAEPADGSGNGTLGKK